MIEAAPLVSVIVIFFNEERFLTEAVASVLAQTYENWELLLIDDGSTDGSTAGAKALAAAYAGRIQYLEHPGHANQGMSATRNLGLSRARGKYVAFLDADDVWIPAKLQEQVRIMETHADVDMVYGRTLLWHSWNSESPTLPADHYCPLGVQPDTIVEPPELLLSLIENRAQTPTTCNALLRTSAIVRVGGFEPEFRGMFEDQVFFMKLALFARVFVASATWAKYRQRPDSNSARAEAAGEIAQARMRLFDWLEGHLHAHAVTDAEIWRVLQRERRALRRPILGGLFARTHRIWDAVFNATRI